MFLNEIFASQALPLRLHLNRFIKWLNLEIQARSVTFRCYPEDFGLLIRRSGGKWRNLSYLLRKHLSKVREQVFCRKRISTLDCFGLDFPLPCRYIFFYLSTKPVLSSSMGHWSGIRSCCSLLPGDLSYPQGRPGLATALCWSPAERSVCADPSFLKSHHLL